jgi:hypothetical protein
MTPDRWVFTLLGLALVGLIVWFFWLKRSRGLRAADITGATRRR